MAGVIQARNCILKMNLLGDPLPIVCAKSFTLNTITDEVETTTDGLGQWKSFDYDALSYTISMEDVVKAVDDNNIVTFDMLTAQTQFIEVGFQIFYVDDDLWTIIITGTAIILNTSLVAAMGDVLTDSIEMHGQGEYTLQRILNPVVFNIIINGVSPASVLFRLLNNLDEIILHQSGLQVGTNESYFIPKGNYKAYTEIQTSGEDNNLTIDTPALVDVDFDGNETIDLPTLRDYFDVRTATFTIGAIPPPPCIAVEIDGSPSLSNGTEGIFYSNIFSLTGTQPFGLTINNKPSWMTISITGDEVTLSGTPTEPGTGIEVDIDITNCTSDIVNFTDTFDIAAGDFTQVDWIFTEVGANGYLKIKEAGVEKVFVVANDSGTLAVAAGASIEASTAGAYPDLIYLKVFDVTGGTLLYENTVVGGINSFTWTAVLNRLYEVTGQITDA